MLEELYNDLFVYCVAEINYKRGNLIEDIRKALPRINDFSSIILDESNFDLDKSSYDVLCQEYLDIVKDILQGLENEDEVMLFDAVAFGMLKFMDMFLEEADRKEI